MNSGTVKPSQIVILAVLMPILAVACLLLGFVIGSDSSTGPTKQLDRAACGVQLPTLPTSDWLAEDDPGWDCSTMGNGHC